MDFGNAATVEQGLGFAAYAGAGALGIGAANQRTRPSDLNAVASELERLIDGANEIADRLSKNADRLLGPVPTGVSGTNVGEDAAPAVFPRLASASDALERVLSRIEHSTSRHEAL